MDTATITPEAPIEPTTRIKPSEALRLGRLEYPIRARGRFSQGPQMACAVGAMAAGWGIPLRNHWAADNWSGVHEQLSAFELPTEQWGLKSDAQVFATYIAVTFDAAEIGGDNGDEVILAYLAKHDL